MKSPVTLIRILFFLTIVMFLCLVVDFLTLHDISQDYVSRLVIDRFSPDPISLLPEWTKTAGEWSAVDTSLFLKLKC